MNKIDRILLNKIEDYIQPNKVVVIYGPRRVGKTTLLKDLMQKMNQKHLWLNGEDRFVSEWLSSRSIDNLKRNIGNHDFLVIDEAQKVDQIGVNLKLIVDNIDGIKVIATGSSSFELANQVGEPLVGRKWQFTMFPVAQLELQQNEALFQSKSRLEERLIYGFYPEVVTSTDIGKSRQLLNSLIDNYLYRDLLELEDIKKSGKIIDLLKLVAFQIGKEVSFNELANQLGLNQRTVERYLDLLEKVFVVFRVYGFSRNLRKEITKNSRFYFYDNGVRNAIINNFNDLNTRDDVGQLWENYLVTERLKKQEYLGPKANNYFWRTYDQKEIDWIEERGGKLYGYEFKWGNKITKAPRDFLETYSESEYKVINKDNFWKFVV